MVASMSRVRVIPYCFVATEKNHTVHTGGHTEKDSQTEKEGDRGRHKDLI